MDYFDILLAKKLSGGGGGDITVEGLNVEENGTYTAPSGKAYSPVVVNLPLDEKTITANGEYLASADDLKGFSKVTVNVAGFTKKAMPTGAISSFNDGTANPLTKLKIAINPVQAGSGDPSPSNPRPISGWTGAEIVNNGSINLWDEEWLQGYYSNTGVYTSNNTQICTKNLIAVKPSSTCYWKVANYDSNTNLGGAVCFYRKDGTFIERVLQKTGNIDIPSDAYFIKLNIGATYGETYNNDISVNFPNTDVTYHVHGNQSIVNVSWQTEAGTVYGGELDVTSGVMTVKWKITDLGSLNWVAGFNGYYTQSLQSEILIPSIWSDSKALCTEFKLGNVARSDSFHVQPTGTYGGILVCLPTDTTITAEQFKESVNGVKLVYEVIESAYTTYQLTPTQVSSILGTNNIWADTGNILEGEYFVAL